MEKVGISMLKKTKRVSISILYFRKVSYVISNTFWEHALNIYFYLPFECYQLSAMLGLVQKIVTFGKLQIDKVKLKTLQLLCSDVRVFIILQVLEDLETYLKKAIPDTKLTIKKYADIKFEYLSFCLKVKEMDDEEASYASVGEPLYRVEAGNYEYR